jgi:hypothetical protein
MFATMKKKTKITADKQSKVLDYLQQHANPILKKHAKAIAGGWDPLCDDPVWFYKGTIGIIVQDPPIEI